jgi:cell division protein FtsB
MMRWFVFVLAALLVSLQARLWLSDTGLRERWALEAEVVVQTARNADWDARNEALVGEVRDLKQGIDAAEERARSDLGLVRADETFYQVVSLDNEN